MRRRLGAPPSGAHRCPGAARERGLRAPDRHPAPRAAGPCSGSSASDPVTTSAAWAAVTSVLSHPQGRCGPRLVPRSHEVRPCSTAATTESGQPGIICGWPLPRPADVAEQALRTGGRAARLQPRAHIHAQSDLPVRPAGQRQPGQLTAQPADLESPSLIRVALWVLAKQIAGRRDLAREHLDPVQLHPRCLAGRDRGRRPAAGRLVRRRACHQRADRHRAEAARQAHARPARGAQRPAGPGDPRRRAARHRGRGPGRR